MDISNPYFFAGLIVVGTLVGAQLVAWLLKLIGKLVSRSQTKLDDYVLAAIAKIVRLGLVIAGVLYAVWYLWPDAMIGPYLVSDLYLAIGFIWGGIGVQRLVKAISRWYADELNGKTKKGSQTIFSFVESLSAFIIWSIVLLLILQRFGIEIGPLLAGLGIVGIALAFGLQDTLSGIFSALYIAVDQPLRIGDYVKLSDGSEGFVDDISWRSVRLKTFAENIVVIPNSQISDMVITNYHLPRARTGIVVDFGIAYGSDLKKAQKISLKVASAAMEKVAGITDFEPSFRVDSLADSSINCKVSVRADKYADRLALQGAILTGLYEEFEKAGISIPYPQLDVRLIK